MLPYNHKLLSLKQALPNSISGNSKPMQNMKQYYRIEYHNQARMNKLVSFSVKHLLIRWSLRPKPLSKTSCHLQAHGMNIANPVPNSGKFAAGLPT
jgi:hypothetical protein